MKNKMRIILLAVLLLTIIVFICCSCSKTETCYTYLVQPDLISLRGTTAGLNVRDDIGIGAPKNSKSIVMAGVPEEYTVEFLGRNYTGKYEYSSKVGGEYTHKYSGDSYYFRLGQDLKPYNIYFSGNNPSLDISENIFPKLSEAELIEKATAIFDKYGNEGIDLCRTPALKIKEYKSGKSSVQREYVVSFNYLDERIKNEPAFYVIFSGYGDIRASSLAFYDLGAPWMFVQKNLSYDDDLIKKDIQEQCNRYLKQFEDRQDLEITKTEIDDGEIRYIYIGDEMHIGVYTRATIYFIQEYPDDFVEKGYTDKYVEETSMLQFVTLLD